MSRVHTRAAWVVVIMFVAMIACEPEEGRRLAYDEDFETACDGVPCGWTRTDGEASQATWIETIHPGEHALRLSGEVTVRGPEATEEARRLSQSNATVYVANRCDLGNSLFVTVVVETDEGMLRDSREMVTTSPDWTNRVTRLQFGEPRIVGGRVVSVILEKEGAGECEVGDIVVDTEDICLDGCC